MHNLDFKLLNVILRSAQFLCASRLLLSFNSASQHLVISKLHMILVNFLILLPSSLMIIMKRISARPFRWGTPLMTSLQPYISPLTLSVAMSLGARSLPTPVFFCESPSCPFIHSSHMMVQPIPSLIPDRQDLLYHFTNESHWLLCYELHFYKIKVHCNPIFL